ncbi:hypothetical protein T4D_8833 [Trichinella pseudospiralis]|uniref:Uncharacterized protein n=1 Tax=Trichinella pseudospiralis TaxID=6337 RepID=A0A0V1DQ03_TRIPS|nr:hypothetical protein T4D_8833 [Trichinella pseudospiralis]
MAFYKGLSEKSKVHGLSEKSKVHVDDLKNR